MSQVVHHMNRAFLEASWAGALHPVGRQHARRRGVVERLEPGLGRPIQARAHGCRCDHRKVVAGVDLELCPQGGSIGTDGKRDPLLDRHRIGCAEQTNGGSVTGRERGNSDQNEEKERREAISLKA